MRPRLAGDAGIQVVGNPVADPARLLCCLSERLPELLLLDAAMFDVLGPRARALPGQAPGLRVLLWCDEVCDGLAERILRHHFHGFLLSRDSPDAFARAIRAVHRGELWLPRALLAAALSERLHALDMGEATAQIDPPVDGQQPLTRREAEVVAHLRRGFTNKEIARRLGIMEDTVKKHLQSVFGKLGVHRRSLVALRQA